MEAWPPKVVSSQPDAIINHCEELEVNSADGQPIVQMAALLSQQSWMAARHLYRRTENKAGLDPYFRVAAYALNSDMAGVWQAIQELPQYGPEIAHCLRVSILIKWQSTPPPDYYASVLGFSTVEEMRYFCQSLSISSQMEQHNPSLTQVVSFLESRMTADHLAKDGKEGI